MARLSWRVARWSTTGSREIPTLLQRVSASVTLPVLSRWLPILWSTRLRPVLPITLRLESPVRPHLQAILAMGLPLVFTTPAPVYPLRPGILAMSLPLVFTIPVPVYPLLPGFLAMSPPLVFTTPVPVCPFRLEILAMGQPLVPGPRPLQRFRRFPHRIRLDMALEAQLKTLAPAGLSQSPNLVSRRLFPRKPSQVL